MGIENYEPQVIEQLLEFINSKFNLIIKEYIKDVLNEAKIFQNYSGKNDIDMDDIRLSIETKAH
jgi:hypothetical protein